MSDWHVFFAVIGVVVPVGGIISAVSWKIAINLATMTGKVDEMAKQISRMAYTMEHIDGRQQELSRRQDRAETEIEDHEKRLTRIEAK